MKSEQVLPARLEKTKRNLQREHSIILLPADKGEKTVVMDSFDSLFAMLRMPSDQEVYKKYDRYPMENIHNEIRAEVNRIANSLPN